MKTALTLILGLILFSGSAQINKITYHDLNRTKKKEVFQVDANGTRNGTYKNYDEEGALRNEGKFKFGKKEGVFVEYTKFPNYAGKMQIRSKETYSNDVKEGAAVYYAYDTDLGIYESYQGVYKNDKEVDRWVKIQPLTKILSGDDYDHIKEMESFKGSMGVRQEIEYQDGQERLPEGKVEDKYFPSGKAYRSFEIKTGKHVNNDTYYYPDGKIWIIKRFDENSKYISVERYYANGKLQIKEIANPYSYEGYNEDGTPDKEMLQAQAAKEKENLQKIRKAYIDSAAVALQSNKVDEAIRFYERGNVSTDLLTLFTKYLGEYKSKKISADDFRVNKMEMLFNNYQNAPEAQMKYVLKVLDAEKLR